MYLSYVKVLSLTSFCAAAASLAGIWAKSELLQKNEGNLKVTRVNKNIGSFAI